MTHSAPRTSPRLSLFLATFGILCLELAIIRWMSNQIRIFAYLNNILLISAFLGMGLGVLIGKRRPWLVHWTVPLLAVLSAILACSGALRLMHLPFPDSAVAMWSMPAQSFFGSLAVIVALFALVASVFVCAGTEVGKLFATLPALQAYSLDLLGSLSGIVVFAILSALRTSPTIWLLISVAPFVWISRRTLSTVAGVVVVVLAAWSSKGAVFSPYYRIDLTRAVNITGQPLQLSVNRDFHQYMLDLSVARLERARPGERERLAHAEYAYRLPFTLPSRRERALVLGAGTGNDAAAALRAGFQEVVSVDIDPQIIALGRRLHPEQPYRHDAVKPVITDARAYLEQSQGSEFDVVCFGLLDSHAMFSAMSSLRLDNYVYTVESVRSAWRMVRPGGILSISFAVGKHQWLSDRLFALLEEATGQTPKIIFHGVQGGRTYLVGKDRHVDVDTAALTSPGRGFVSIQEIAPPSTTETVLVPRDDWPFLYLRPGSIPLGYIAVLASILILALLAMRLLVSRAVFHRDHFDVPLFFMGAAFLLIETRSVTDLSLLFGSTWIVNAFVFAGILLTVWVANELVRRIPTIRPELGFAALMVALLINYWIRPATLLDFPLLVRGTIGALLNALPVGFAGLIFSRLLLRSAHPDESLGSNLLGAVLGGCLEYLSMATGLRALTLLALVFYLVALFLVLRASPRAPVLTT